MEIDCNFFIEDQAKFDAGVSAGEVSANLKLDEVSDYFGNYFKGDAWDRAKAAKTISEAKAILDEAYLGCDTVGIGLYVSMISDGNEVEFFDKAA